MLSIAEQPYDCALPIPIGWRNYRFAADSSAAKREGNRLWPASIALAQIIADLPAADTVCALGDGLGMVGLVASARGSCVTIIDKDSLTCELTRKNFADNDLTADIRVEDWSESAGSYDAIYGAEIVYAAYGIDSLCRFLANTWTRHGRCLLTSSHDRNEEQFSTAIAEHGFVVTKKHHNFVLPNGAEAVCWLWEVAL
jgi:ribosomal protein L11 methylase PrmA